MFVMKKHLLSMIALPILLSAGCAKNPPVKTQSAVPVAVAAAAPSETAIAAPKNADGTYMAPSEIVAKAPASDWIAIAPSDLLVMDLAPSAGGKPRRVVIQLMPPPFSQGWVGNIRKLAAAHFWDGTSVNRVQDNYVVQWGDATEKKALPDGLVSVPESAYEVKYKKGMLKYLWTIVGRQKIPFSPYIDPSYFLANGLEPSFTDSYSENVSFAGGFPVAVDSTDNKVERVQDLLIRPKSVWPVHCYGMVGVGRNLSPDTGTGAELYTVIGHAPRHLDRNIALVGRVISGMEHLSSLPRGTGPLGFYETPEERTTIVSVGIMDQIATDKPFPTYEYLSTESASFAAYADARANRRDPFFNLPAGGADICNIPVPIRKKP